MPVVLRRVPAGDNSDAAHRTAPLLPPPLLIYLISLLRSRSFASTFFTRSFIHSSIHSFIHSASSRRSWFFATRPPFVLVPSGEQPSTATEKCLPPPSPTDTPARWRNKKPGLPTDGDNPILQLEPSSSPPRIGTRSSSSSWLTLARSMPTQQVIINKRLTNERARAQRSDGPMK